MAFYNAGSSSAFGHAPPQYAPPRPAPAAPAAAPPPSASKPAAGAAVLATLEKAARLLHDKLAKDAQMVPELGETLTGASSAAYNIPPHRSWAPFFRPDGLEGFKSMPTGVFDEYDEVQPHCCMGIFPEIQRAWITLNNRLLLWDYTEGSDIRTFEDQPDVILHVGLVKSKRDIFIDEIKYLLVLSTAKALILIGVAAVPIAVPSASATEQPRLEVKLYETGFTYPAKEMQSIVGTSRGRIFMCGSEDGYLYELTYQSSEGWFSKKLDLICHSTAGSITSLLPVTLSSWRLVPSTDDRIILIVVDDTRQCLYTLTQRPHISMFSLGPRGDTLVLKSTLRSIYAEANRLVPVQAENFAVVDLHVIQPNEAKTSPHLMAVTSTGARLYFSHYRHYYMASIEPEALQLVHVRLAPTNLRHPPAEPGAAARGGGFLAPAAPPSAAAFAVGRIEGSCYAAGVTIARQSPAADPEQSDHVVCVAPDPAPLGAARAPAFAPYAAAPAGARAPLTEYASVLAIAGNAWDMCEVPRAAASAAPPAAGPPAATNELATQFAEPQRRFLVLTNMGLNVVVKRRAVDFLGASLVEADLGNQAALQDFLSSFGRDQTCAMLFALAAGNTFLASDLGQHAAASVVANNAKGMLFSQSGKPVFKEAGGYGSGDAKAQVAFSGRHDGFALYFARVVRPIWRAKITTPGPRGIASNVAERALLAVQKNLEALRTFVAGSPHLFDSPQGDFTGSSRATAEQEAWKAENASASELKALLAQAIEAISFVLLLQDYGLVQVTSLCDPAIVQTFNALTYDELVTTKRGRDCARGLVTAVINQQIGQQISVDTISEVLQSRCGSFCSMDDVKYFKAQESLRKATETTSSEERARCLQESLKLFVDGARIMELDNLQEIVKDYRQCSYATGAIFLPLRCAQEFDITNEGREYWDAGCPPNDPRVELYQRRLQCYDLCLDSLSFFDDLLAEVMRKGELGHEQDAARTRAYQLSFESQDQVFHSYFYDWLIRRGMTDELLEYRPMYLESHLQREPRTLEKLEFLWQYYVKTDQALRAAKVLADIAESTEFNFTLDRRIEYLTLSVNNAMSHRASEFGRHETAVEFLTDIEEKLEVAQVQREVYHNLAAKLGNAPQGQDALRLRRMESTLLNITELYAEYADPYNLYTSKLLIFKVSDHRDNRLTRATWDAVVAESRVGATPEEQMANLSATVSMLTSRFFPSEAAFPLDDIALMLEKLALENHQDVAYGWAPRALAGGGVPYPTLFDVFHNMYESQIPPFSVQESVQFLSSDIAVLISDWLEEAIRPQSSIPRGEFPANMLDEAVNQYLRELEPSRAETRQLYENLRVKIRRNF